MIQDYIYCGFYQILFEEHFSEHCYDLAQPIISARKSQTFIKYIKNYKKEAR